MPFITIDINSLTDAKKVRLQKMILASFGDSPPKDVSLYTDITNTIISDFILAKMKKWVVKNDKRVAVKAVSVDEF